MKLINEQDWSLYKWKILTPIVDSLNASEGGLAPLRKIIRETLAYSDCSHLLRYPDGKSKKIEAEQSVKSLQALVLEFDEDITNKKKELEAIKKRRQDNQARRGFDSELAALKKRFYDYMSDSDVQARGFGLEDILYDLFVLFDLDPKGAFRRTGEQIDGAFSLDAEHFLLEAKWQRAPVILSDLRDLDGAVGSSLDNTLGLFISINGFSETAIAGYLEGNRPRIICMDGEDLTMAFEAMFDFSEMLKRKKQIAVQNRRIFAKATNILRGEI
jgi:hypothetical protein